jgi:hypothetical protein
MKVGPATGITVRAHVERMLSDAQATLGRIDERVKRGGRIRPVERDEMRRELAGVLSSVETVRLWLQSGAPQ